MPPAIHPRMAVCIVYHSETGNTRAVAGSLTTAIGGDIVEVKDLAGYSKVGMYLRGAPRAMRRERADIEPATIDVSGYEVVVIGTPVWAGNPTPAIDAAVVAFSGIEGRAAVVFCTSGGAPGKALERVAAMLVGRGADVRGAVHIVGREVRKPGAMEPLLDLVRRSRKEEVVQ